MTALGIISHRIVRKFEQVEENDEADEKEEEAEGQNSNFKFIHFDQSFMRPTEPIQINDLFYFIWDLRRQKR